MLRAQNIRSVQARYPSEEWPDTPAELVGAPAHFYSPLEVIHAIHCYEYQSCETEDWESTDACRWCRDAERTLLRQIPEYDNAEYHLDRPRTSNPHLPVAAGRSQRASESAATKAAPVALTIRDGVASSVVYEPGLEFLQQAVDGYIETAFRLPSPLGGSLTIDAYVNEEGAINGMEPSVMISSPRSAVFCGPLIIVGGDDATGENRGLEPEEVALFSVSLLPNSQVVRLRVAPPQIKPTAKNRTR